MIVKTGNIWIYHFRKYPVCIPTNGSINKSGDLVMGRGLAYQARKKYQDLSRILAGLVKMNGNVVQYIPEYNIISFPVKHSWNQIADIKLIEQSTIQLMELKEKNNIETIILPKVGCGNGKLQFNEVKKVLEKYLDDNYIILI